MDTPVISQPEDREMVTVRPKVVVAIIGDTSQLPEGMLPAMQSFVDYLNNADYEKVREQYRKGVLGELKYNWMTEGT